MLGIDGFFSIQRLHSEIPLQSTEVLRFQQKLVTLRIVTLCILHGFGTYGIMLGETDQNCTDL